jgi:hypothetical protein
MIGGAARNWRAWVLFLGLIGRGELFGNQGTALDDDIQIGIAPTDHIQGGANKEWETAQEVRTK